MIQHNLYPIIESEVEINLDSSEKKQTEVMLKESLLEKLNKLNLNEKVFLKLTLPTVDIFYEECICHPNVLRIVALSGGYDSKTVNELHAKNKNMVASFSSALT